MSKRSVIELLALTSLALVTGVIGIVIAVAFTRAVLALQAFLPLGAALGRGEALSAAEITVRLAVPAGAGLIIGGLMVSLRRISAITLSDVLERIHGSGGHFSVRAVGVTIVASFTSLAGGASLGQYGPLASIGAAFGTFCASLVKLWRHYRLMAAGAGAAAAIAAAFNAPIAGIIFAHEVLLRHFGLHSFAPITVAASLAFFVGNFALAQPIILPLEQVDLLHPEAYPVFALLGALGALAAVAMMRLLDRAFDLSARSGLPVWARPVLAGLVLGVVGLWLPEVLGIGLGTMDALIGGSVPIALMLAVLLIKPLATALSLGFGFVGGVLAPALVTGTALGSLVGALALSVGLASEGEQVIYAICGLAAVASAVMGAPLTTILIVFELTRSYEVTTAALSAVVVSSLLAREFYGRSFFDHQLAGRNIDLSFGSHKVRLSRLSIDTLLEPAGIPLAPEETVEGAVNRLGALHQGEAQVVDAGGLYRGTLRLADLIEAYQSGQVDRPVRELITPDTTVLTKGAGLWQATEEVRETHLEYIPVIASLKRPTLLGVVDRSSLYAAFLTAEKRLLQEENR